MNEIRFSVEISDIKVNIQCDPKWLTEQMGCLMEKFPGLFGKKPVPEEPVKEKPAEKKVEPVTLKQFLVKHDAMKSQNRIFLGTAIFLFYAGQKKLLVRDINLTLKNNNLPLVKNPNASRYQLARRGLIQYVGKHFAVTQQGVDWL